eukprot:m.77129 g.77129  ORF g.77129 m.77129 type:complete len:399 (+) comp24981_c0_seq2:123-1319(+)
MDDNTSGDREMGTKRRVPIKPNHMLFKNPTKRAQAGVADPKRKQPIVHPSVNPSEDWSAKQGRILSGDNRIADLYKAPKFPFDEAELPHFHLLKRKTHQVFREWNASGKSNELVAGAWTRPLFVGGWEHSDNILGERVFNLQTGSIFIDIRIPIRTPNFEFPRKRLDDLSLDELRWFARRHAFAGYSHISGSPPVCVRHHAIDWNFVGKPRNRPNKWRIEKNPTDDRLWKEWGFARDDHGQHIYMEQWERLPEGEGVTLAMRRVVDDGGNKPDAFVVVVGDHFNFIENRSSVYPRNDAFADVPSLTALVDNTNSTLSKEDLIQYLSLRACHGRVSNGWVIEDALHPWEEGTKLIDVGDVVVQPNLLEVRWKNETWEILECNSTVSVIAKMLASPLAKL